MIDLLEQNIAGLTAKLAELRTRKDLFLKAAGIQEEEARVRIKIQSLVPEIETEAKALAELTKKKSDVVGGVCAQIAEAMSAILPYGKAVFKIEEDSLFVGWDIPGRGVVVFQGLSGGEEAAFRPALGYVLAGSGSKVIAIEGAELDDEKLDLLLKHLPGNLPEDVQVLLNTCHEPKEIPDGWAVTRLGEVTNA